MTTFDPARASFTGQATEAPVVLIVEDEVLVRFALADHLREQGFKVYEARNADEAIQLLSFYRGEVDVIFSDIVMPGELDGFELAMWVRKHRPDVQVILNSAYYADIERDSNLRDVFFSKPYDLKAVVERLAAAVRWRKATKTQGHS